VRRDGEGRALLQVATSIEAKSSVEVARKIAFELPVEVERKAEEESQQTVWE